MGIVLSLETVNDENLPFIFLSFVSFSLDFNCVHSHEFYDSNSDLMSTGIKHAKAFNALETARFARLFICIRMTKSALASLLKAENVITLYHFCQSCSNSYANWFSADYCYHPVDLTTIAWDDVEANDDMVNDSGCCCCSSSSLTM